jgi:mono/diheme cytochrome c family protein
MKSSIAGVVLFALVSLALAAGPKSAAPKAKEESVSAATPIQEDAGTAASRLEGERRFRANCGRCHQAPGKFPPRMMATIVRHMRVRATITEDDRKLILNYLTQ